MFVQVQCPNPSCGKTYRIAITKAGRKARCRACGTDIRVPAPAAETPSPTAPPPPADEPIAAQTLQLPDSGPTLVGTPSELLGRFEVRGLLGEGAFGRVYRAYDPQLQREVALKVAKPGSLDTAKRVERFLREARAAAQLYHPHLVPVFDAGRDGERYYIATAYIAGQTLQAAIDDGPLELRAAVAVVRQLAEAVAYAHEQGIVHRDIKPSNVLLDARGQPHLLDFGVAARQDESERLTAEGAVMGTPMYMAPEQAAGQSALIGPAADQYSLGVVLYELLCGQTPFGGPPEIVVFNHLRVPPPPPRSLRPGLPRDLESVCLKALAKRPAERYADCQALADDLRRWLEDEPVLARRQGPVERAARLCRQNPAATALTAGVVLALTAGTVVSAYYAAAADSAARQADAHALGLTAEKERADGLAQAERAHALRLADEKELGRRNLYAARLTLARHACDKGDLNRALELLGQQRPQDGQEDLRAFEWYHLWQLCQRREEREALKGHNQGVQDLAFARDGASLAAACGDGLLKLWDLKAGTARDLPGHKGAAYAVAFAPDGQAVASAGADGFVRLWDARMGQSLAEYPGPPGSVTGLAFSPDGTRLASVANTFDPQRQRGRSDVTVRATQDGRVVVPRFEGDLGRMTRLAFSPDGNQLAGDSDAFVAEVWDARTGRKVFTLKAQAPAGASALSPPAGPTGPLGYVAFSPDGNQLACATGSTPVTLWNPRTGQQLVHCEGHLAHVHCVAFSHDGRRLASGDVEGTVKLWDTLTGQETFSLKAHAQKVTGLAFSADGTRLASGSQDGTVRLWEAPTTP